MAFSRERIWALWNRAYIFATWVFWKLGRPFRRVPSSPRRILVVQLNYLGDAIVYTAVHESLRVLYPNASVDVLCSRWNRQVVEALPHINRVFELSPWHHAQRTGAKAYDHGARGWKLSWQLRRNYDLIISLCGSWSTLPFVFHRAYVDAWAGRMELTLRRQHGRIHILEAVYRALELDLPPLPRHRPVFPIDPKILREAESLLRENGILPGSPFVVFHAARKPYVFSQHYWPAERWASLAEKMVSSGFHVVLVGSKSDESLAKEIQQACKVPLVNLVSKTSFLVTAGVITQSSGFVGIDSGPMHLAAALGRPTLGIFFHNSGRVWQWYPLGRRASTVSAPTAGELSVDEVYRTVRSLL